MSVLLGLRIAFAGGRESVARVALMMGGVAIGVVLLLLGLTAMPALQGRIDRYAWHRTEASAPATAPDPALWLAVTDRYAGRNIIRVHIAPLGPRPPVPPGVSRLPGAGEVVVSPALASLLRSVPDDQLGDRFPGRVTGTIGPAGLVSPDELVAVIGHTPEQLRATVGGYEIHGFERPGEGIDLVAFVLILVTMLAVLLLGPLVVFIALVTRVGQRGGSSTSRRSASPARPGGRPRSSPRPRPPGRRSSESCSAGSGTPSRVLSWRSMSASRACGSPSRTSRRRHRRWSWWFWPYR